MPLLGFSFPCCVRYPGGLASGSGTSAFKDQLGRDLVLVTITFDPDRDQPEVLQKDARTWKADPTVWHFLTGPVTDVHRVTDMFGMDFFPDEGLMNHSLHTAVIDRQRKLVANIEGNQYSAEQLGDSRDRSR